MDSIKCLTSNLTITFDLGKGTWSPSTPQKFKFSNTQSNTSFQTTILYFSRTLSCPIAQLTFSAFPSLKIGSGNLISSLLLNQLPHEVFCTILASNFFSHSCRPFIRAFSVPNRVRICWGYSQQPFWRKWSQRLFASLTVLL